jgi:hypothetical protein
MMIVMVAASVMWAAAFQSTAADGARSTLRTCIKEAANEAKGQKMASDAFTSFAMQKCTSQASTFKSAVWAFDSKNKVSKKQSESDANMQIEDFVSSAASRYQAELQAQ